MLSLANHHHACGSSVGAGRARLFVRARLHVSVHGRVRMSTYACMCECGGRTKALVAVRALRRTPAPPAWPLRPGKTDSDIGSGPGCQIIRIPGSRAPR